MSATAPPDAAGLLEAAVGRAAGALCAMVNVDVEPGPVGPVGHPVQSCAMAVRLELGGGLRGSIVLLLSETTKLGELLQVPDHLLESAVAEVGNIVGSHLLLGLEAASGRSLSISPPEVTTDGLTVAEWVDDAPHPAGIELRSLSPLTLVLTLHPDL